MKSIGLMSGTSLDGLDICYVEFSKDNQNWSYNMLITKSVDYNEEWKNQLRNSFGEKLGKGSTLDVAYGKLLGDEVNKFIKEHDLNGKVDFIASHGHTVFHQPSKGITVQIGDGAALSESTNILVINDFRIKDVELGGQGAPLVPIGDLLLFHEYQACLNLGGFSNISFDLNDERIAFDISPCNLPLNKLMLAHFNREYDNHGEISKTGRLIPELLDELNNLEFYQKSNPKSLGFEWLEAFFYPVLDKFNSESIENIMRTITEHIAIQIADVLNENAIKNVLITGGGVYNGFLIERVKSKTKCKLNVPSDEIIEFKEALIFAFLGALNFQDELNTLKSVTGAKENSIGGIRHYPL